MGIGIDIEEVERFRRFDKDTKEPFLPRVFTPAELMYCFGEACPAEHLTGRFAAKEAVKKALAKIWDKEIAFNEIGIARDGKGAPLVIIDQPELQALDIELSISHTRDLAVAVVVIISNVL